MLLYYLQQAAQRIPAEEQNQHRKRIAEDLEFYQLWLYPRIERFYATMGWATDGGYSWEPPPVASESDTSGVAFDEPSPEHLRCRSCFWRIGGRRPIRGTFGRQQRRVNGQDREPVAHASAPQVGARGLSLREFLMCVLCSRVVRYSNRNLFLLSARACISSHGNLESQVETLDIDPKLLKTWQSRRDLRLKNGRMPRVAFFRVVLYLSFAMLAALGQSLCTWLARQHSAQYRPRVIFAGFTTFALYVTGSPRLVVSYSVHSS